MTPRRTALQKEISDLEYSEAVLELLKCKAERQLEVIAHFQHKQVLEMWRALLDIHTAQDTLSRERYRISVCR